jgi:hypothetical protein
LPKTAAYRLVLSGKAQGTSVSVFFDVVALLRSRAEVFLGTGSAFTPPAKAMDVRLARMLAARMKAAMRGA